MRVGYFLNTYPTTSSTFIRREIEAHEEAGFPVARYAIRPWAEKLVDARDLREAENTTYLLKAGVLRLLIAAAELCFARPRRFFRALAMTFDLRRAARGDLVRHLAYFLEACLLVRLARRDKIDHIHAHFSTNAAAGAMLAHALGGPSYSFTVHGPDEFDDAKLLSLPQKVAQARFVVAISEFCRAQIIRFSASAYRDKIKIVRCGVFLDEFTVAAPSTSTDLVCVGRLTPQKGQALIAPVMRRVREKAPDAKVILIGDGPDRSIIEAAIADENVGDAVTLLGWRDNRFVRDAIEKARALLLPTAAEGLPVVLMEAMATGRPVISTYIAGIPELLDSGCGWIVPAGDEAALAAAVAAAVTAREEDLARLGAEGRRRVERLHDMRKNAAELRALFQENPR